MGEGTMSPPSVVDGLGVGSSVDKASAFQGETQQPKNRLFSVIQTPEILTNFPPDLNRTQPKFPPLKPLIRRYFLGFHPPVVAPSCPV